MWLAILELTVTADYRNAPFSSVRGRRDGENSGISHEIEETGFEEGKREEKRKEGREGKRKERGGGGGRGRRKRGRKKEKERGKEVMKRRGGRL